MKQEELDLIVANHKKYSLGKHDGVKAYLSGANLCGANLLGSYFKCDGEFHHITNIGSEGGTLELYSCGDKGWFIRRGCFSGSEDEFIKAVNKTHGDNKHGKKYIAIIELFCN